MEEDFAAGQHRHLKPVVLSPTAPRLLASRCRSKPGLSRSLTSRSTEPVPARTGRPLPVLGCWFPAPGRRELQGDLAEVTPRVCTCAFCSSFDVRTPQRQERFT